MYSSNSRGKCLLLLPNWFALNLISHTALETHLVSASEDCGLGTGRALAHGGLGGACTCALGATGCTTGHTTGCTRGGCAMWGCALGATGHTTGCTRGGCAMRGCALGATGHTTGCTTGGCAMRGCALGATECTTRHTTGRTTRGCAIWGCALDATGCTTGHTTGHTMLGCAMRGCALGTGRALAHCGLGGACTHALGATGHTFHAMQHLLLF